MIEVTLRLYAPHEFALFAEFMKEIEKIRNAESMSAGGVELVPAEVPTSAIPLGPLARVSPEAKAALAALDTAEVLVKGPTPEQMETAVKAYGHAKGFPAARELLNEYTKGKIGDVPAEKRAELYARLTA